MTIDELHYDVKNKVNKLDSQQYKNLLVPEIDWVLREAEELFVKLIAFPRVYNHLGFERNQRSIDDIRTIVESDVVLNVVNNEVVLPENYWHYIDSKATVSKNNCNAIKTKVIIRQHDDEFESSPFDKSSYIWKEINAVFYKNKIKLFPEEGTTIENFCFSYIRKPVYLHNALRHKGNKYVDLKGNNLSGQVTSELPDHTHREIVDIAVLLISGQIQSSDYQIKQSKLALHNLK